MKVHKGGIRRYFGVVVIPRCLRQVGYMEYISFNVSHFWRDVTCRRCLKMRRKK